MKIEKIDVPTGDNSSHYNMISDNCGVVQFGILDNEMCAHTWYCPNEGEFFLKSLEKYALKINKELTIPNVINPKLEILLIKHGYKKSIEKVFYGEYIETVEIWKK